MLLKLIQIIAHGKDSNFVKNWVGLRQRKNAVPPSISVTAVTVTDRGGHSQHCLTHYSARQSRD